MLTPEQITGALLRNQLALTAFIASVSRSYHLAEDVFQEVCINAIGQQPGFDSEAHLINWARRMGRFRAIDALRARDGKFEGLTEDVLDRLATTFDHESVSTSLKQEALRQCLQSLTPNNLEILRLRYFENRTSSSIAEFLSRKVTTVYQSIARLHQSLGDCVRVKLASLEVGQ